MQFSGDSHDTRIEAILQRWFDLREAGSEPSLEELCSDVPHLIPRIQEMLDLQAEVLDVTPPKPKRPPLFVDRLGDYELQKRLASGGMGDVYLARQVSLDRMVAVKVLRPELADQPVRRLRFKREAKITAALDHPNIVPVYEAGEDQGFVFLAMKRLEGDTLDHATENWSSRRIARVGAKVAQALHAAHEVGVVHRDIKPANILLDGDHPYVLDFGLARARVDLTLTTEGQIPGTLQYMPPEQLRGNTAAVDPRADIYSLGATLYQCVARRPPFDEDTPEALVPRVLVHDPDPLDLSATDRDLEVVLLRALEKDPARRFGSALEFAEDLERYAEGRPILSQPPSLFTRAVKLARRHRVKTVAIGAALLAAIVVSLVLGSELRANARRADNELERQLGLMKASLDAHRPAAAYRRLGELNDAASIDPRVVDIRWRVASALERDALLDQLQTDWRFRAGVMTDSDRESLERAHPDVAAEASTAVVGVMFAYYANKIDTVENSIGNDARLARVPRFRAAFEAHLRGDDLDGALDSLSGSTAADHVFTGLALRIFESSLESVESEIDAALAIDPFHRRGRLVRALLHAERNDLVRAEEALRLLWSEDDPWPDLHVVIANLAMRRGAFDLASEHLQLADQLLELTGREPVLRVAVAHIDFAFRRGDRETARTLLTSATERFGASEWLDLARARLAFRDDFATAMKLLERIAESRLPWNRRAAREVLLVIEVNEFVQTKFDSASAMQERASVLLQRAEEQRAEARAAHDQPNAAVMSVTLHRVYDRLGDDAASWRAICDAVVTDGRNTEAVMRLAKATVQRVLRPPDSPVEALRLGDIAVLASRRAAELTDRAAANPRVLDRDERQVVATCAAALCEVVGNRSEAVRMGSIANSIIAGAEDDVVRILEITLERLDLAAWPAPSTR